jgi:hypothetical protein
VQLNHFRINIFIVTILCVVTTVHSKILQGLGPTMSRSNYHEHNNQLLPPEELFQPKEKERKND